MEWKSRSRANYIVIPTLLLAILLIYWPVVHYPFVNYDDTTFIAGNSNISHGLTLRGVVWAFSTIELANWYPLTILSHMTDFSLFGMEAGAHHLVNVAWHAANSVLLFLVLTAMTAAAWPSALVAALFAVHPLHVEAVAWISARKDVLSTFFWLLTMATYLRYVRRPGAGRYALVLITFVLGLMAKSMLVSLPLVLLLLDWWPLGRMGAFGRKRTFSWERAMALFVEKLPLFAGVAVIGVVTYYAQQKMGAMELGPVTGLGARCAVAVRAYAAYVPKMIWPSGLAVLYPLPRESAPLMSLLPAGLFLAVSSVVALTLGRRRGYPAMGWLWYVVTLLPVSGIIRIGSQSLADRYTYVPLVGVFLALAWALGDVPLSRRYRFPVLAATSVACLVSFAVVARCQTTYWRDSVTLMSRAVTVTTNNWLAHNNLAVALAQNGQEAKALEHFEESVRLNPTYAKSRNNLGYALLQRGRAVEAIPHLAEAIRLNPGMFEARVNLAAALIIVKRFDEARNNLKVAINLVPDSFEAIYNLGYTLSLLGDLKEAVAHLRRAVRLRPDSSQARAGLGSAFLELGQTAAAREELLKALQLDPGNREAQQAWRWLQIGGG